MKTLHFARRALSVLLCALLLALCLPVSIFAEDGAGTGSCGDGLTYTYNETSKKLTISGAGNMTNYASPADVPWASYRGEITSVEIGDGVTAIGSYAFYYCTALNTVIADEPAYTSIGDYAFWMCTGLTEIDLPGTLTAVGKQAFAFSGLTSVAFTSLSALGEQAFLGCIALSEVAIEGTLSEIRAGTFANCTALKTVAYPEGVTVAAGAFQNCGEITESTIQAEATLLIKYVDANGKEIAERHEEVLAKGAEYRVESPKIEGYTVNAAQAVVSGSVTGADKLIEIEVSYAKNASEETETAEPPQGGAETGEETGEDPADEPAKASSIIVVVLLVLILAAIAVGAFLLLRSDKKVQTTNTTTVRKKK